MINAIESHTGLNQNLRIESAKEWISNYQNWDTYYQELNNEITNANDFFAFNMCKLNEVKVRFETIVFTSVIKIEKKSSNFPSIEDIDNSAIINVMLKNIEKIADNYKSVYHVENLITALSTKYEIVHFLNNIEGASEIASEIEQLIEFHDLKEQKKKFHNLQNEGTIQERLKKLIQDTFEKSKLEKIEYDSLVEAMKLLDSKEQSGDVNKIDNDSYTIELFPIGHFAIPKKSLDEFYEILQIDSYKLTKHLNFFFENGIIPVLNIYNHIIAEGYANGKLDDKGIESWRRIHEIRNKLYLANVKRRKLKIGL